MKIQPLQDRVLVELIEPEKVTKGGILLPDNIKPDRNTTKAKVLMVGPGRCTEDGNLVAVSDALKIGSLVLIGHYAGNQVDDEDSPKPRQLRLVSEREVLAVFM